MKVNNIMEKGNMVVSNTEPLINQIKPSKKLKDKVYIMDLCQVFRHDFLKDVI